MAITAGAGGIGRVIADSFAACGAAVFVSDIDETALAGYPHASVRADAGDAAAMERFIDDAANALGGLDVLVNNAGIGRLHRRVEAHAMARGATRSRARRTNRK